MAKYAVMTSGVGRCASKWLVHMFNRCTTGTVATHEGLATKNARTLKLWDDSPDVNLLVDVSWNPWTLVTSFPYKPKVCFLLREPLDIVRSWMTRTITPKHMSVELATKRGFTYYYFMQFLWRLDTGIFLAKDAGLDVSYWDYKKYTTPEGFRKLAEYVGADVPEQLNPIAPVDVMGESHKLNMDEWFGDTTMLMGALDGFLHAKLAYTKIRAE